jgi:hypothetical protein
MAALFFWRRRRKRTGFRLLVVGIQWVREEPAACHDIKTIVVARPYGCAREGPPFPAQILVRALDGDAIGLAQTLGAVLGLKMIGRNPIEVLEDHMASGCERDADPAQSWALKRFELLANCQRHSFAGPGAFVFSESPEGRGAIARRVSLYIISTGYGHPESLLSRDALGWGREGSGQRHSVSVYRRFSGIRSRIPPYMVCSGHWIPHNSGNEVWASEDQVLNP